MALNPYESPRGRLRGRAEATRRQFLLIMGGLATAGASLFGGIEVLRFMFPVASSNAPALFKTSFSFLQLTGGVVGGKAVTPVNVITDTNHRVSVILDDAGIYAVLLICTHLGCTPNYVSDVVTGSGVAPVGRRCPWCAHQSPADPQRLGVPVPRQPLLHRLDQLLRSCTAPDGLGQHRGDSGRILRGGPRDAGRDAWPR